METIGIYIYGNKCYNSNSLFYSKGLTLSNPISWFMVFILLMLLVVIGLCMRHVALRSKEKAVSEEKDLAERIAENPDNRHN